MIGDIKEVYFGVYCSSCKHWNAPEDDDICHECLNSPGNIDSNKPINYREED